ncbi:hypothetical protein ACFLYU_00100 [Candidatus Dependentiae bacterium]
MKKLLSTTLLAAFSFNILFVPHAHAGRKHHKSFKRRHTKRNKHNRKWQKYKRKMKNKRKIQTYKNRVTQHKKRKMLTMPKIFRHNKTKHAKNIFPKNVPTKLLKSMENIPKMLLNFLVKLLSLFYLFRTRSSQKIPISQDLLELANWIKQDMLENEELQSYMLKDGESVRDLLARGQIFVPEDSELNTLGQNITFTFDETEYDYSLAIATICSSVIASVFVPIFCVLCTWICLQKKCRKKRTDIDPVVNITPKKNNDNNLPALDYKTDSRSCESGTEKETVTESDYTTDYTTNTETDSDFGVATNPKSYKPVYYTKSKTKYKKTRNISIQTDQSETKTDITTTESEMESDSAALDPIVESVTETETETDTETESEIDTDTEAETEIDTETDTED